MMEIIEGDDVCDDASCAMIDSTRRDSATPHSGLTAYELRKIWKNVPKYIRLRMVQLYSSTFQNGSFFDVFFYF